MKQSEILLLPLFERFIKDTYKGRRLKSDGTKIKTATTRNYDFILRYLQEYELLTGSALKINVIAGNNRKLVLAEKRYWKRFYLGFTDFLYKQKNCFDNYVGTVIKIIRIFFRYINKEYGIKTGEFYKDFYICKEEIPVITLLPQQLQFLINDEGFDRSLTATLKKRIFWFSVAPLP